MYLVSRVTHITCRWDSEVDNIIIGPSHIRLPGQLSLSAERSDHSSIICTPKYEVSSVITTKDAPWVNSQNRPVTKLGLEWYAVKLVHFRSQRWQSYLSHLMSQHQRFEVGGLLAQIIPNPHLLQITRGNIVHVCGILAYLHVYNLEGF